MKQTSVQAMLVVTLLLSACATTKVAPPVISLDEPVVQPEPIPEPAKPVEVVRIPEPLPLPGQLQRVAPPPPPGESKSDDPSARVTKANQEARVAPTTDGFVNAIQIWPYTEGALYQVYARPGRVTDILLQAGEELVSVSAGDTTRWVVGETTSGSAATQRVHVLVKPIRANLSTNLLINTNRRSYLLELTASDTTWMASVSWQYPQDRLVSLERQAQRAERAAPVAQAIPLERLRFRYELTGDSPPWRPLRAFDDAERVYIQFPAGIAQGELPPLFVIGPTGNAELVNYRYRAPYFIVDRLFGAAELRLGGDKAQVVRITRTDAVR